MLATSEARMQFVVIIDTGLAKAPAKIHFSAIALGKEIHKTDIEILQYASVGSYLSGNLLDGDEVLNER